MKQPKKINLTVVDGLCIAQPMRKHMGKIKKPIVTVYKNKITIPEHTLNTLHVKQGDKMAFANRKGVPYIAVSNSITQFKGYTISRTGTKTLSQVSIHFALRTTVFDKMGFYVITESEFISGIEWYKLELYNENE